MDIFQNLYIIIYNNKIIEIKTFITPGESWLFLEQKNLNENLYDSIGPFKNRTQVDKYIIENNLQKIENIL